MKHYGFRGTSGSKQTMSPKLYEAITEKLHNVWGEYAGWAHSVRQRLIHMSEEQADCYLKVLFTADLKAFSDYGLPTPTPSPRQAAVSAQILEGYFTAPIQSSRKRRRQVQTR
jgi:N-glycosylase/DNA lyase